jgi:hypothetical protein
MKVSLCLSRTTLVSEDHRAMKDFVGGGEIRHKMKVTEVMSASGLKVVINELSELHHGQSVGDWTVSGTEDCGADEAGALQRSTVSGQANDLNSCTVCSRERINIWLV